MAISVCKNIWLSFAFLAIGYILYGQDQIITTQGDTLDCKITRVTEEFIHFSVFDAKTGIILMRSRLPRSGVQSYFQAEPKGEIDASDQTQSPRDANEQSDDEIPDYAESINPARLRLAINAGYTYQFGGYEGLPNSYTRQLQSLWNIGGSLHYFTSENFGIGFKYSRVATTANEDFLPPFNTLFGFTNLRDERVRFNFYGFSLMGRQFILDDQIIYYSLAIGSVNYRTDLFGDGIPFFQEGDTFGVNLAIGYDFVFNDYIGIGVGIDVNFANLREFNNNGVVVPSDFNISRVDLTAGIRLFR